MKRKALFWILPLFLLASCEEPLPKVKDNNTILYKHVYDMKDVTLPANQNRLTDDKEENLRQYFLSYASHFSRDTEYTFLYRGKLKGRNYKIDVSYDSSKTEKPYFLAVTNFLDEEGKLPDAYYFFSDHFNLTDFKSLTFLSTYYYDYEKGKDQFSSYETVSYQDIQYQDAPMIESVSFTITKDDSDIPSSGKKDTSAVASAGFECIRVAAAYLEKLFNRVSSSYHLW